MTYAFFYSAIYDVLDLFIKNFKHDTKQELISKGRIDFRYSF